MNIYEYESDIPWIFHELGSELYEFTMNEANCYELYDYEYF